MEILKIFKQKKALLTGHFLLSSGKHSEHYLQCALLLQYPKILRKLSKQLVYKLKKQVPLNVGVVLSPAIGGILVGQAIAEEINKNCRAIFTERDETGQNMILRRGFTIKPKEKVIIAEDVITTGGTTEQLMEIVKQSNAKILCICSIVDRAGQLEKFQQKIPFIPLLKLDIKTYNKEECPFCKKGIPLVKPGSRKI